LLIFFAIVYLSLCGRNRWYMLTKGIILASYLLVKKIMHTESRLVTAGERANG